MITIVAAPGRRVRTPQGVLLPEEGLTVPRASYWLRRLADGDVILQEGGE